VSYIDTRRGRGIFCFPVSHTESNPKISVVAIIPARYLSTRLPGKALLEINGRPMILWTLERALAARGVERAIVATDDKRILEVVKNAGFEAVMTSPDHHSGSDRLAEVAATLPNVDAIVNVQGDEPMISPLTIERAIAALSDERVQIATADEEILDPADITNPNVVKVVSNEAGRALYFSRQAIPFPREEVGRYGTLVRALSSEPELMRSFRKHTGLYVYRRAVLLEMTRWEPTPLERSESLEQLRALEHGVYIAVVPAASASIGVDTAEDLDRVRELAART
jgi:3-deoxy-manno-octulosonate cytidylyltransferase (CMP-KDO synthetase)